MGKGIEIGLVCHDEEIVRLAANLLAMSNRGSLSLLQFESCNGELTITGAVESYYEKQIALNCCRSVPGVVIAVLPLPTIAVLPYRYQQESVYRCRQ